MSPDMLRLIFLVFGLTLFGFTDAQAQENADVAKWLEDSEQALAKIDNYTANFHRVEFVDGKLTPEEVAFLKFKRPFKVYFRWIKPSKGQESLYVDGANHNKIRAHASGMVSFVTVNLDPNGT